jgi:hypothetical protein
MAQHIGENSPNLVTLVLRQMHGKRGCESEIKWLHPQQKTHIAEVQFSMDGFLIVAG